MTDNIKKLVRRRLNQTQVYDLEMVVEQMKTQLTIEIKI